MLPPVVSLFRFKFMAYTPQPCGTAHNPCKLISEKILKLHLCRLLFCVAALDRNETSKQLLAVCYKICNSLVVDKYYHCLICRFKQMLFLIICAL